MTDSEWVNHILLVLLVLLVRLKVKLENTVNWRVESESVTVSQVLYQFTHLIYSLTIQSINQSMIVIVRLV